jgi:hypothetical protein
MRLVSSRIDNSIGEKSRFYSLTAAISLNRANKRRISPRDVLNGLNNVMLTAIEANHGREKADKFDMLVARFSEGVSRLSGSGFSSLIGQETRSSRQLAKNRYHYTNYDPSPFEDVCTVQVRLGAILLKSHFQQLTGILRLW